MTARQFAALWDRRKAHLQAVNYAAAHIAAMYHGAHGKEPHPTVPEFLPFYEPPVIPAAAMVEKFLALGARKVKPNE